MNNKEVLPKLYTIIPHSDGTVEYYFNKKMLDDILKSFAGKENANEMD